MNNKGLRFLALLLAFALVITLFAGCLGRKADEDISSILTTKDSNLNMTGLPIVKEKINLTGVGLKGPYHTDWNKMLAFQEYENMTNIHIDWNAIPQDSYSNKVMLMIESGDLPDLFLSASFASETKLAMEGIIIPLNGLIKKYAPTLMGIMAKDPTIIKSITQTDGNIYTLPQLNERLEERTYKSWINKKWLDALSLNMPASTDEFYNVLKAFKERDPNKNSFQDEIPFSGSYKGGWSDELVFYFAGYWGFGNPAGMVTRYIDTDKDGKIRFFAEDPKYKEVLIYLNKLWNEGLIDKDFFTMNYNTFTNKLNIDTVGFAPGTNSYTWLGKNMNNFVSLPALKGPYGDHIFNIVNSSVRTGTFAITGKNRYPEATMRWVDYLYTKEGTILFRMGIEGKTYKKLPDGRIEYLDGISKNPQGFNMEQVLAMYTIGAGAMPRHLTQETDAIILPKAVDHTKVLIPDIPKEIVVPVFTPDQTSELSGIRNNILSYITEMNIKFITGEVPFSNWDIYTGKLKELGSERYKLIYEDAYNRWKGTN